MHNLSVKRAFAAVLLCLLISACSIANKNLARETSVESGKSLAAGDFQKALDGFKAACKKDRNNKELTANYVRTAEEIKRAADRALGQGDYARAGNIYRVLLYNCPDFGAFAARLTFNKYTLETDLKKSRTGQVDGKAHQALEAGDFAKALETYQAAFKENPGDVDLTVRFRGTVNDIEAAGDRALGDKDFALAGRVNAFLLRNFPAFEGLQPPVAFSRGTLRETVAICRDGLTKAGLEEYRKGNLAKAIAVWEALLAFDPDNAEIKKAVNTAMIQLNEIIKKN